MKETFVESCLSKTYELDQRTANLIQAIEDRGVEVIDIKISTIGNPNEEWVVVMVIGQADKENN